jgi:CRP/FNR family transcriptional regulator, cyclic AMP receptor protein
VITEFSAEEIERLKIIARQPKPIIGQTDSFTKKKSEKTIELKKISKYGSVVKFHQNQVIFKEGDNGGFMYIVLSGNISITDSWDDEIAIIGSGDVLGEMAVVDGLPRSATAITTTEVTLFRIFEENLEEVISVMPSIAMKMLDVLSRRCRVLMGNITEGTAKQSRQEFEDSLFDDLEIVY